MRKIEKEMLEAISQGCNWSKDNTQVIKGDGWVNVRLHGNDLGAFYHNVDGFCVNEHTLKQYPTVTTKSRLRALGANVYTKKGVTYLDGLAL